MKILGYSERGIINSLIFSINSKELMSQFVKLIDLPKPFELKEPIDYTLLLEQSFSDFGDADLIIIIHYENQHDKVLFLEGKVKTYGKQWNIEKQLNNFKREDKYNGCSSNLFFQLYLKAMLMKNSNAISKDKLSVIESKFRTRKIGVSPVVWKAFEKVSACNEAYFIGLIPATDIKIKEFTQCATTDFSGIMLAENLKIHFLSWEKVHRFCKEHSALKNVLDIFEYNKGQIY